MSLLCFILAGGKSTRMGHDKTLIHDSVNTLSRKLEKKGCIVVVACGSKERAHLFNSNCWPDPVGTESLADTIRLFVEEKQEQIQLFPCDMYRLDDFALDIILGQPAGVPVDAQKNEQFTLARIPVQCQLPKSKSLHQLFSNFHRNDMRILGDRIENFNSQDQIDALNKSNQ